MNRKIRRFICLCMAFALVFPMTANAASKQDTTLPTADSYIDNYVISYTTNNNSYLISVGYDKDSGYVGGKMSEKRALLPGTYWYGVQVVPSLSHGQSAIVYTLDGFNISTGQQNASNRLGVVSEDQPYNGWIPSSEPSISDAANKVNNINWYTSQLNMLKLYKTICTEGGSTLLEVERISDASGRKKSYTDILKSMAPTILALPTYKFESTTDTLFEWMGDGRKVPTAKESFNKDTRDLFNEVPTIGGSGGSKWGTDGRIDGYRFYYEELKEIHTTVSQELKDDLKAASGSTDIERLANIWDKNDYPAREYLSLLYDVLTAGKAGDATSNNNQTAGNAHGSTTDAGDATTGVSTDIWADWYMAAWKVACGVTPGDSDWNMGSGYESASNLLAYSVSDSQEGEYWLRVYDILSLAYSLGGTQDSVKTWDPNRDALTEAYEQVQKTQGNTGKQAPNGVTRYAASLENLNSYESLPSGEVKRAKSFYDRITSLYHVATLDVSLDDNDYNWIKTYYEQDSVVGGHYIQDKYIPSNAGNMANILVFSGSEYTGYPSLSSYQDGKEMVMPYLLETIWELPYLRAYEGNNLIDAIKNSTILDNREAYDALCGIKQAVDELGIPMLTALWEEEDSSLEDSYNSLKKMYEACQKDAKVVALGIEDKPQVLSTGKPLSAFFEKYGSAGSMLSKYYSMGIAYTSTLVPMRSNVYSSEFINYLDDEFYQNFYYLWGFNRKALYVDKSSGAGEAYFTSGKTAKGNVELCTLRDLLEAKDDVVLYLDDNFYNTAKLQQSMTLRPTYDTNVAETDKPPKWWNNLASAVEETFTTNFENVFKTGTSTNYSKTFYEMMSKVDDAHVYYPEATDTNPGNSDNIVMSSGKINYYLNQGQAGSEIYSPLQGYAVVSSVYRDGELYSLANSAAVQRPVFIASKTAPYVTGATVEQMQTIFNYALLKNLKAAMPVGYAGNLDMDCPLYMDILGNVLTESGTVVIPATANATLMNHAYYYKGMWSAGLFSVYGLDYKIPVKNSDANGLSGIVGEFFQPDASGKYYIPKPVTLGETYKIDMSRLSTTSRDTLDMLYTTMVNEIGRTAQSGDPAYDFDSYVQIALEVLRGAPIEDIDKEAEGLATDDRVNRAGIVAAAKLEDLNNALNTNGDNTSLYMPNIAFMPGLNYLALLLFKVLVLVVIVINMVTILYDAASESLNLGTFWKCFMALVLTMLTVLTIPAVFEATYYQSNRALLQEETAYISMLNLEKSESGVEIGVTEVKEPDINTKLYLKLENINIPWYELFYNSFYTNSYKTLNDMYENYALSHTAVAIRDDVEVKNDGVYIDVNDVYGSSSVDLNMYGNDPNARTLVQTATNKTATFSFYSPYYAILDALIENVNYFNAHPTEAAEEQLQGWYAYTTKKQKGGRIKTLGLTEAYFASSRFMEEDGKDILGLKSIYSNLIDDNFEPDPAMLNFYTAANLQFMQNAYWYPEGMSSVEVMKRIDYLTDEARNFVAKNKDMLGKISDETFLKVMALDLAIKHNRIFGAEKASTFEIYNLSSDDLIRLSVADRKDVMVNSTLSYPRFIYTVGGTSTVYAAALLSMVMRISSIVKPLLVLVAFLTIFISIFIFRVCMHKKGSSLWGYFITTLLLCLTNVLYSVVLKLSMFLPKMGLTPFLCIAIQIVVQIVYMVVLLNVVGTAFREWHDLGYAKYANKAQDMKLGLFHFMHKKRGDGVNPFYGGTTAKSDPEKNWNYYDTMMEERRRRSR